MEKGTTEFPEHRLRAILWLLGSLLLPAWAQAAPVEVNYSETGAATLNFSELEAFHSADGGIGKFKIEECGDSGSVECSSTIGGATLVNLEAEGSALGYTIDKPGIYRVTFYADISLVRKLLRGYTASSYDITLWSQFVAVLPVVSDESLISAIDDYAPLMSFHDRETFFPVYLRSLWGRPIGEVGFYKVNPASKNGVYDTALTFGDALREGGVSRQVITLSDLAMNNLVENPPSTFFPFGQIDDFPLYWSAEYVSANEVVVNYFSFFGNDIKRREYISPDGARTGSGHPLDREAVALKFVRNTPEGDRPASIPQSAWFPVSVTYSGHGDRDDMAFTGCTELNCARQTSLSGGDLIHSFATARVNSLSAWDDEATTIDWPFYSRSNDYSANSYVYRPVVYVADGSHAQYPAYGFYIANPQSAPSALFYAYEPAGSASGRIVSPADVRQIVLSDNEFAPLRFSGKQVRHSTELKTEIGDFEIGKKDGFKLGTYRFPPFVKATPARWANGATNEFQERCFQPAVGCDQYMLLPDVNSARIDSIEPSFLFVGTLDQIDITLINMPSATKVSVADQMCNTLSKFRPQGIQDTVLSVECQVPFKPAIDDPVMVSVFNEVSMLGEFTAQIRLLSEDDAQLSIIGTSINKTNTQYLDIEVQGEFPSATAMSQLSAIGEYANCGVYGRKVLDSATVSKVFVCFADYVRPYNLTVFADGPTDDDILLLGSLVLQ